MDDALGRELVTANRVLARRGVVDGFGHVSVRLPERPDRFLIARSTAPATVTDDDLLTLDLDGEVVEGEAVPYLERFIHSEIYRRRPDVASVVHSHAASVVPFSVSTTPLRAVSHMCGFLGEGAPVFDVRSSVGDASDLLVRDAALGAALADVLADAAVVLMRGHGSTVVGETLRQAVFRAVYTEVGARTLADALRLGGEISYLTAAEAEAASRTNDGQIDRAWDLWARGVG